MDVNTEVGSGSSKQTDRPLSLSTYSEVVSEERPKIRVFVSDDQPLLRYGISAYLNSQPDMVVCGEAGSVSETRSKISACQPHFLVTALRLGAGDSLKLIKELKAENAALRILVYSAFDENIFAERVMRAGANGYIMKQAPGEKLASAIRDILNGGIYVSREVALGAFRKSLRRHRKNNRAVRSAGAFAELSDREMHIFQLIGSALGTRKIAESLGLSVKTVETHQENIKHKLRVSTARELRARAGKWVEQSLRAEEQILERGGAEAILPFVAPVTTET